MSATNIEIKCLENPEENWPLLIEGFMESRAHNPMTAMITGFQTTCREQTIDSLRKMVISSNLPTIIAWDHDKQKVAGQVMLRGVTPEIDKLPRTEQPGGYKFSSYTLDEKTTEQINNIYKFVTLIINEMGSFFDRYPDLESYAFVSACGVLQEYTKQGIASKLMTKCLQVAAEHNYQLIVGNFSSLYSQKIAEKFGFETIIEFPYEGNYLNHNALSEEMRKIHKTDSYCVKWIETNNRNLVQKQ